MTIAAVVVTYNRRQLLERTLAAIEAQTLPVDELIVINNASTDETALFLKNREFTRATTIRTARRNTGGAGGFAMGVKMAYEAGHDAVWLMDDDTIPTPRALAELVTGRQLTIDKLGFDPSFVCSLVRWKDDSLCEMNTPTTTWDWLRGPAAGEGIVTVDSCSFVSVLVTRTAIHQEGLPAANFFIWYDDAEYTQRLSRLTSGVCALASEVHHLLPHNRGVNFSDVTEDNLWKFRHGVRNQMASSISLRKPAIALDLAERLVKQAVIPAVRGRTSPRLVLKLLLAACRGVFFRPMITYPDSVV